VFTQRLRRVCNAPSGLGISGDALFPGRCPGLYSCRAFSAGIPVALSALAYPSRFQRWHTRRAFSAGFVVSFFRGFHPRLLMLFPFREPGNLVTVRFLEDPLRVNDTNVPYNTHRLRAQSTSASTRMGSAYGYLGLL